jgi:dynactin-4
LKNPQVLLVRRTAASLYISSRPFNIWLAQLQRTEDSAPDSLEFERLKEHFEPFIRASAASSSLSLSVASPHHTHTNSATAAASAALARDIPGVVKYSPLTRSRSARDKTANRDEMPEYKSRLEIAAASAAGSGGGEADVEFMKHIETISEVTSFEQRCVNSWVTSMQTRFVRRCIYLTDGDMFRCVGI